MSGKYPTFKFAEIECKGCGKPFTANMTRNERYCTNSCQQKYHARRPERREKNRNLKMIADYGITAEFWDGMFIAQGKRCAICGEANPARLSSRNGAWATDHDHVTKKVRGILCNNCNWLLGNAKDDTEILRRAIDYLDKHKD